MRRALEAKFVLWRVWHPCGAWSLGGAWQRRKRAR